MKSLLVFLLVASVSANLLLFKDFEVGVDPYDLVRGFLKGIGEKKSIDDLMECFNKIEPAIEMIRKGLKLLMTLDYDEMGKGVVLIINGLQEIYNALEPCVLKYKVLHLFVVKVLSSNPLLISFKIVANIAEYRIIFNKAIECIQVEDLMCAGENLGNLMNKIFVDSASALMSDIKVFNFIKGFLRGLGDNGDPTKLKKCLDTLDNVIEKILQALEYIMSGEINEIIKGITMLLEGIKEFVKQLRPCIEGLEILKKLFEAINDADYAKIMKKLLLNLNRVVAECAYIIDALKDADYEKAGFGFGNFLKYIFLTH